MSFAAPLIGGIGSLIGGLFNKGGGSGARQDTATMRQSTGNLNNVFNYAMPTGQGMNATGQSTTAQGVNAMSSPLNYWQSILHGNRSQVLSTMAPETNAEVAQQDASRRQQASVGTARGGGVAAGNQQQQTQLMSDVNNRLFGLRSEAPGQIAQIGKSIADTGQSEEAAAARILGLGTQATTSAGQIASGNTSTQASISSNNWNRIVNSVGGILSGINLPGAKPPTAPSGAGTDSIPLSSAPAYQEPVNV